LQAPEIIATELGDFFVLMGSSGYVDLYRKSSLTDELSFSYTKKTIAEFRQGYGY